MDVALFGAAGYSGLELVKLLATHPRVRVVCAASDANAGRPVAELVGRPHPLKFVKTADALAIKHDLALLAVPPEPAKEIAAALLAKGVRVVDLSNAHRASDVYGLTSLFSDRARDAKLVANPGCYATCAITAIAPLFENDLVDGIVAVSAGSGVTGAGRTATAEMSLGEMYGEVRAYRVLKHQHVPEIEAALARVGMKPTNRVVMTTHLLPIARGIFMTVTAKLARKATGLIEMYRTMYAGDPTVIVGDAPEDVSLRKVVGTNTCLVGVASDDEVVVVTAALDNLLKGAAGQAIENMNLMAGFPRMAGLEHLARQL
ncbi:MAG: N-acetyl-gamma-glutamyl-phosphate reductase [Myxococcota bacterium]|nr:N-acetyl-gamma-glutamyl-phosphate reductase [Deltaproteobacteria bacterium]MDQ3338271.1 N-acetyl-gamma-glutamyl-phosphate reductase [Myxococcota bacterium]